MATRALLGSLRRTTGDLDRVTAWLAVSGMVNVAPGVTNTTNVMTPCSELVLELFGPEVGAHARTAIGMAQLPLDLPVATAAEVAIRREVGESVVPADARDRVAASCAIIE